MPPCRLYLITPPRLDDLAAFSRALDQALDGGDVAALQLRLKGAADAVVAQAVQALAPPLPRPRRGADPQRPAGPRRRT